jgi:hypothetical protein
VPKFLTSQLIHLPWDYCCVRVYDLSPLSASSFPFSIDYKKPQVLVFPIWSCLKILAQVQPHCHSPLQVRRRFIYKRTEEGFWASLWILIKKQRCNLTEIRKLYIENPIWFSSEGETEQSHEKWGLDFKGYPPSRTRTSLLLISLQKLKLQAWELVECTNGHASESETNWPNICKI